MPIWISSPKLSCQRKGVPGTPNILALFTVSEKTWALICRGQLPCRRDFFHFLLFYFSLISSPWPSAVHHFFPTSELGFYLIALTFTIHWVTKKSLSVHDFPKKVYQSRIIVQYGLIQYVYSPQQKKTKVPFVHLTLCTLCFWSVEKISV